ncbi:MAG: rhodanese-like domain-containing protein [Bacteroidia bacterium]
MNVHQFYDEGLAHASYAVVSEGEMAVVDPARDPQPYLDLAEKLGATIKAVIETHPHADFVSSHAELARKAGAKIYTSKLAAPSYTFTGFDEGDALHIGNVTFRPLNTPGHSPDSISVVLYDDGNSAYGVFTGDTLFVGDVGRPDLREAAGNLRAKKEELASQMYDSLRNKLMRLPRETRVYPAHGPGSLCGRAMGNERTSTIGKEVSQNYALQDMPQDDFVKLLLENQPFMPKYFGYDVEVNRKGAKDLESSIQNVHKEKPGYQPEDKIIVVDGRNQSSFKAGHYPNSINIPDGLKFETWLGSIIEPDEEFYLTAEDDNAINTLIRKASKIGYEQNIKAAFIAKPAEPVKSAHLNKEEFDRNEGNYTILDIRNQPEIDEGKIFEESLHIPLHQLRERISEIPSDKPIVVHCAGGYRSAAGASILENTLNVPVYDLGESIRNY